MFHLNHRRNVWKCLFSRLLRRVISQKLTRGFLCAHYLHLQSDLPDDGSSKHVWNISQFLRDYTAQYSTIQSSSYSRRKNVKSHDMTSVSCCSKLKDHELWVQCLLDPSNCLKSSWSTWRCARWEPSRVATVGVLFSVRSSLMFYVALWDGIKMCAWVANNTPRAVTGRVHIQLHKPIH